MSEVAFTGRCPQCGYSDRLVQKPVTSAMNTYKSDKGSVGVFNKVDDKFEGTDGTVWTKQKADPASQPISLKPGVKAPLQTQVEVVMPVIGDEAGDASTGVAKGATIIGAPPGARDSSAVATALASIGVK